MLTAVVGLAVGLQSLWIARALDRIHATLDRLEVRFDHIENVVQRDHAERIARLKARFDVIGSLTVATPFGERGAARGRAPRRARPLVSQAATFSEIALLPPVREIFLGHCSAGFGTRISTMPSL